jgi:quercetin dioxygenase-like cupin family protein
MHRYQVNISQPKGWFVGPWNSNLPISIGFASRGIDDPHKHSQITEVYLVTNGTAELRVEKETLNLSSGDMIIIEPGEAHTFITSSPEYFHVVLHVPGYSGEEALQERCAVTRASLGLV